MLHISQRHLDGAALCSDGIQRSPACALPATSLSPSVGFVLWNPTQAGLLP
jgi:hypothetical protein